MFDGRVRTRTDFALDTYLTLRTYLAYLTYLDYLTCLTYLTYLTYHRSCAGFARRYFMSEL